jgi:hypothetical protein
VSESLAPIVLGMFVQVEGDRMFLDRHLVIENAETKPGDAMFAYLSVDGYWCASLPHCKAADCECCLDELLAIGFPSSQVRR